MGGWPNSWSASTTLRIFVLSDAFNNTASPPEPNARLRGHGGTCPQNAARVFRRATHRAVISSTDPRVNDVNGICAGPLRDLTVKVVFFSPNSFMSPKKAIFLGCQPLPVLASRRAARLGLRYRHHRSDQACRRRCSTSVAPAPAHRIPRGQTCCRSSAICPKYPTASNAPSAFIAKWRPQSQSSRDMLCPLPATHMRFCALNWTSKAKRHLPLPQTNVSLHPLCKFQSPWYRGYPHS